MIIDGHAHACGDFLYAEKIIEELDRNGIDKIILSPGELNSTKSYSLPDIGRLFPNSRGILHALNYFIGLVSRISGAGKTLEEGNRYVYSLCKKYPSRILQAYWVNSFEEDFVSKIEVDYCEYKFRMVKTHQCWGSFNIVDKCFEVLCKWALLKQLPIFIHLRNGKEGKSLLQFIKSHQDNIFIIGHLIGFEPFIGYPEYCRNVYFDISCPALISHNKIKFAIEAFGAERILFGSDVPYGRHNQVININRIAGMDLSDKEKEMILGGNLQRIVDLGR